MTGPPGLRGRGSGGLRETLLTITALTITALTIKADSALKSPVASDRVDSVADILGRLEVHLRSRAAIALIAAALLTSLSLGVGFVVTHRIYDLRGAAMRPVDPLTDAQSRQQVLEPARQFVAAGLQSPSASYLLMSCTNDETPLYQGTVYLNFDVPSITETPAYFRRIAAAMVARGWHEGLAPNRHPGGRTLAKDGVTAVYYRSPEVQGRGVLEINGECRNMTDHSLDTVGFVDVTEQLGRKN